MSVLLNIPASDVSNAAAAISQKASLPVDTCTAILNSYIGLGSAKAIQDYGTNSQGVAQAVTKDLNSGILSFLETTYYVTDVDACLANMTQLANNGLINIQIAYPNKWETQLEQAQTASTATSTPDTQAGKTVIGSLSDVLTGIGTGAQNVISGTANAVASGLGIDIQTLLIIAVVGVLVIVYFKYR